MWCVWRLEKQRFPRNTPESFLYVRLFHGTVDRPVNWGYLGLGDYSTAWWRFILEVTEGNQLRFWTGGPNGTLNPDGEYWYMTYAELGAWQTVIRNALDDYNAEHPDAPLTHDDGAKKGEPVKMPN